MEHKIPLDGYYIDDDPDEGQEFVSVKSDGDCVYLEVREGVTIWPSEARAIAAALVAVAQEVEDEHPTRRS